MTETALTPGSLFAGDFRVIRPLNEGGMGSVYVVEQLSTRTQRALKIMHAELVKDPRLRERFEQEARVGGQIESDHVVQVIGAGVDQVTGFPWLAMELLKGEDLQQYADRRGAVPREEVALVMEQLCHALAAAHAVGVVHRDLKPENIFLATSRRAGFPFTVKVLDFGVAKIVANLGSSLTTAVGTPLWMSPEQAQSQSRVGAWTDVWALGLIVFRLLTGEIYWKHKKGPLPTFMRELLADPLVPATYRLAELGTAVILPDGFDDWFAACVNREPSARFAAAGAAQAALDSILKGPAWQLQSGSWGGSSHPRLTPVPAASAVVGATVSWSDGVPLPAQIPVTAPTGSHSLLAPESLAARFEENMRAGKVGRASVLASVLVFSGRAEARHRTAHAERTRQPPKFRKTLDPTARATFLHHGRRQRALASAITALAAPIRRVRAWSTDAPDQHRVRLSRSTPAEDPRAPVTLFGKTFFGCARVLAVDPPRLLLVDGEPGRLLAVPIDPPTSLACAGVLEGLTRAEMTFMAAHHVMQSRPEHVIRALFDEPRHAITAVWAGLMTAHEAISPPAELASEAQAMIASLAAAITPDERAAIRRAADTIVSEGRTIDVLEHFQICEAEAARGALLCCDDPVTAARLVDVYGHAEGEWSLARRQETLLAWAVSDAYFALRELVGLPL